MALRKSPTNSFIANLELSRGSRISVSLKPIIQKQRCLSNSYQRIYQFSCCENYVKEVFVLISRNMQMMHYKCEKKQEKFGFERKSTTNHKWILAPRPILVLCFSSFLSVGTAKTLWKMLARHDTVFPLWTIQSATDSWGLA